MIDYKDPAALRELMEKVTEGPWEAVNHYETDGSEAPAAIVECENQRMVAEVAPSFEGYEDAQFIALSREALPYWIERAEAAERAVERLLEELIADCPAHPPKGQPCVKTTDQYGGDICRACWREWAMKAEGE